MGRARRASQNCGQGRAGGESVVQPANPRPSSSCRRKGLVGSHDRCTGVETLSPVLTMRTRLRRCPPDCRGDRRVTPTGVVARKAVLRSPDAAVAAAAAAGVQTYAPGIAVAIDTAAAAAAVVVVVAAAAAAAVAVAAAAVAVNRSACYCRRCS